MELHGITVPIKSVIFHIVMLVYQKISGWWFFATPLKNDGVKVRLDDENTNWMESHKIPWFQTTNQLLHELPCELLCPQVTLCSSLDLSLQFQAPQFAKSPASTSSRIAPHEISSWRCERRMRDAISWWYTAPNKSKKSTCKCRMSKVWVWLAMPCNKRIHMIQLEALHNQIGTTV